MRKIFWISQFPPLDIQILKLKEKYGDDCAVAHKPIKNAREVAEEFKSGGYADLVAVVPLATLDHVCREGVQPLWAEMSEVASDDGRDPDLKFGGKRFWFVGYRRVRGVSLEKQPATPLAGEIKKILRLTRHQPLPEEAKALQALYPGCDIETDTRPISDGREIVSRFRQSLAGDLLIVAPYSVIDQIIRAGIQPLWAEVKKGQFKGLFRIKEVRIEFE